MEKASSASFCSAESSDSASACKMSVYSTPNGTDFHSDPCSGAGNVQLWPSARRIRLPWRNEERRLASSLGNSSELLKECLSDASKRLSLISQNSLEFYKAPAVPGSPKAAMGAKVLSPFVHPIHPGVALNLLRNVVWGWAFHFLDMHVRFWHEIIAEGS
jgi:hypothetical protein